ncbi:MAG: DNA/RNA non-specific endonuclease [Lactobacillaceae bacterium]|jgi:DNA-entry nuclease|nr:DNA/RNA non-specific endonuclease [Lactobacillaceae bacterium]
MKYEELQKLNFNGRQIIQINNGIPEFNKECIPNYFYLSELDYLNRAGLAFATISQKTMPKQKRPKISFKPTGWQEDETIIDGSLQQIYNRSHLLAWDLIGIGNEPKNLITGTRLLNGDLMQLFENRISSYVENYNNEVRYQVVPIFKDDNLLASGVWMMAQSSNCQGISFNVYLFNVQTNIEIDYKTGRIKK